MPIALRQAAIPTAASRNWLTTLTITGYGGQLSTMKLVQGTNNSAPPATFGDFANAGTGTLDAADGVNASTGSGTSTIVVLMDTGLNGASEGDTFYWGLFSKSGSLVSGDVPLAVSQGIVVQAGA